MPRRPYQTCLVAGVEAGFPRIYPRWQLLSSQAVEGQEVTIYWFTYLIGFLYLCNAVWLFWHGDWVFAGYWLSALSITVFSFLLASR
jgi:hypothetical protein